MRQLVVLLILGLTSCTPKPMLMGPPSSLTEATARFSGGVSWSKPLDSSEVGVPQVDGAVHLPVGGSFDLAVRAWSLGGGLQGRLFAASRDRGSGIDLMVAPLLGISTVLEPKEEGDESLVGPIDVEFVASLPIVLGFGAGSCTIYAGGEPTVHLRPDLGVLRAGAAAGLACPIGGGKQIAPELSFEMPVLGGDDLRPEDGFAPGEARPALLSQVLRLGISLTF